MNFQQINQLKASDIVDFFKKVDKRSWIKAGILGSLFLVITVMVIMPAWMKRMEVRQKIKSLEAQIATVQNLSNRKLELEKNKTQYNRLIEGAKQRIFEPGETSFLLGAISRLAKESNVSIIASQPKEFVGKFPEPFSQQYEGNVFDFTVEGKYHSLGAFIGKIESNPKLLRIQTFTLKPSEKSAENHLAEISLTAVSLKKSA